MSAGLAWGCTPQATIGLDSGTTVSGGPVTVSGTSFAAKPVEIRWGSASGPVLATAQGPSFTAAVRVPSAAPGTYYIAAVARDGARVWTASTPVEIRPTAEGAGGTGQGAQQPDTAPAPQPGADGRRAGSPARDGQEAGSGRSQARPGERAGVGDGRRSDGSGRAGSEDSVTPAPAKSARAAASFPGDRTAGGRPSERTLAADLWGSYARGDGPSQGAQLVGADPSSGRGTGWNALVAIPLGLGMTALLAGLLVTGRRRRVAAGARE